MWKLEDLKFCRVVEWCLTFSICGHKYLFQGSVWIPGLKTEYPALLTQATVPPYAEQTNPTYLMSTHTPRGAKNLHAGDPSTLHIVK